MEALGQPVFERQTSASIYEVLESTLRGTLQAQVHFADVPNDTFTVHRSRSPATNPIALRRAITRHLFDPVHGQVSRQTCVGEFVPTYCSIDTYPLAVTDRFLEQNMLLHEGEVSSVGRTLYGL